MPKKSKELDQVTRAKIIAFVETGLSYQQVALRMNLPKSTVGYVALKHKKSGLIANKPGRGRKPIISERLARRIERHIKTDRRTTAIQIAQSLQTSGECVISAQTVRNTLKRAGLNGRIARKKPFLSPRHKKLRLDFATAFCAVPLDEWNDILFCDESKFNVSGSDGRFYVWRKAGEEFKEECLQGTVKHGGGSVMVWGCMAASGVGKLVIIDGIMNAVVYRELLRANLKQSAALLDLSDNFFLWQDNDPKHTAKIVKAYLQDEAQIRVMPAPPQSPDLNPIEHLWDVLGRRLQKRRFRSVSELKVGIMEEWKEIGSQVTGTLVGSMKRRLDAVILSKGSATKY
jgi:transposase